MTISIILVRPLFSGNLGSVARAMKNMGLKDLRLVSPQASPKDPDAQKMAAHAKDILAKAKSYAKISEAVHGFHLVVGTSRRHGKERGNWNTPREFAQSIHSLPPRQKIALLFGPEDSGLTSEEVSLCQKMITIPSHPETPSLNLAQAVMVIAYELFLANLKKSSQKKSKQEISPAQFKNLESMYDDFQALLLEIGFLNKQNPEHLMRLLRNFFNRSRPTEKEIKILACNFRDDLSMFSNKETQILGVSYDDADSHQSFKNKFSLNFPLLVDKDRKIAMAYGVEGEKYANRDTVVIDKEGKILKIYRKVDPKGHSGELLNLLGGK